MVLTTAGQAVKHRLPRIEAESDVEKGTECGDTSIDFD